MQLATEIFGEVAVVHTPEELGEESAGQLQDYVTSLDCSKVIIDMDGTETIDSSGLETLLDTKETLQSYEGDLKISTGNSVNRKILEITRLDQHLEVFESVIEAVKSFE